MKTKTATTNGLSKQDRKHLALMDDYFERIKDMRADMKRSLAEIDLLEGSFQRKMAEINSILKAC